jgi:transposase
MEPASTFVGVIVSQAHLHVTQRPSETEQALPNTAQGTAAMVTYLQTVHPRAIAVESTGGDQWPVVQSLVEAMLPVIVVNPRRIRDFALATGLLTEEASCSITDVIEARILAHFAETVRAAV